MSAGLAFARAASHPIMSGVRDFGIDFECAIQARTPITTSRSRLAPRRRPVEDGFLRRFFLQERDRLWQWQCQWTRTRSVRI